MANLDPAQFSATPRLLLDAASIAQSDGSDVSSWSDLSGNGNNGSASSGSRPLYYGSSSFGNVPLVRFNNSKVLTGSLNAWLTANMTLLICISSWAGRGTGASAYSGLISGVKSGDANDYSTTGSFATSNFDTTDEALLSTINNTNFVLAASDFPWYTRTYPTMLVINANGASSRILTQADSRTWRANPSNNLALTSYGIGQRWVSSAWTTGQGGKFDLHGVAMFDSSLSDANLKLDMEYMFKTIATRAGSSGSASILCQRGMNGGFPR